jgi:hypothetical protein
MGQRAFEYMQSLQKKAQAIEQVAKPVTAQDLIGTVEGIIAGFPSGHEFTTDDIWKHVPATWKGEPRAMGAAMLKLAKRGVVVQTGAYRKSSMASCNARPKAIWRRP